MHLRSPPGWSSTPRLAVALVAVVLLVPGFATWGTSTAPARGTHLFEAHPAALASGLPAHPGPRPSPAFPSSSGSRVGPSVAKYVISGTVAGVGSSRVPLGGLNVTLFGRPCASIATPTTCPYLNHTQTQADGTFQMFAPNGAYFLAANNSSDWGGSWEAVSVSSGPVHAVLGAYPWVPYGNATFVLPAWNNLSAYASNCNAVGPCGYGVYGTQDPLLSWTSDGVYYVNATGRLVFYSFANGTVRDIAPWLYLYDDLMAYQGIENTEWITADGSYVYEFGCTSDCQQSSNSPVVFYAVNTTTGQTFRHTFGGVTDTDLFSNAQIQMIGENGNASIATLIDAAGNVYAWNLWNRTQWKIGTLDYFEANNIYWFPTLNSFLNVQADGSTSDGLEQVMLEGPAPGTKLVTVVTTTYGNNFLCNGVNGVYLNVTSHRIGVSVLTGGGPVRTEFWQYNGTGRLTGSYTLVQPQTFSSWPNNEDPANVFSSEHRPTTTSDGPMFNGIWDGMFGNNSWLYEPSLGQFYASNLSADHIGRGPSMRQSGMSPASVESMFVNTSYEVVSESVNCRTNGTTCPIRGNTPGTVAGTLWWSWKLGLPELPFAANVSGAETLPPGPVNFTNTSTPNTITLTWTRPPGAVNPVVNYTLFWRGARAATNHAVDLWAENRSYRITGLPTESPFVVCMEAWNLHWHGGAACSNVSTALPNGPLVVHDLSATPGHTDVGLPVRLTVNGSGGAGPLGFNYTGLPSGCTSQDVPSFACVPASAGIFTPAVNVTDTTGAYATASTRFSVAPRFLALPTIPGIADLGQNLTLTYTVVGVGTPPYVAAWTVAGVPYNTTVGSSGTLEVPAPAVGSVPVTFVATDALGESAFANVTVVVAPVLAASLNATPSAIDVGLRVNVTAELTGGTAPTNLTFGTVPAGCVAVNATALACRLSTPGDAVVSASASDAAQATLFLSTNFTVNPDPLIATFGPSAASVNLGSSVTWRLAAEFGTGGLRVAIAGLPPGCFPPNNGEFSWVCQPNTTGVYRVTATVVDGDEVASNATATLAVHSPTSTTTASSGVPIWEVGAALGLLLLLGVLAVVAVRRRRPPAAPRTARTRP